MNELPVQIVLIVGFVVYPFAITALVFAIIVRSKRSRYPLPFAKLAAVIGCLVPMWLIANYGLGKIPSVIIVGSAVFVFAVAETGGLIGAIADLFIPMRTTTTSTTHTNSIQRGD